MKQSKLDIYILSGLTNLLSLNIYMSNVLTKNWKENGKAVKGLKYMIFQKCSNAGNGTAFMHMS